MLFSGHLENCKIVMQYSRQPRTNLQNRNLIDKLMLGDIKSDSGSL